ncbi:MAG: hypothetical protein AAGD25_38540 [Cyanobacteria bacterium P01_F01_bin.150]
MTQSDINPTVQPKDDAQLSDDQLTDVSGGLSGRIKEEFEEGLGNKRLSASLKEEFVKGAKKEPVDDA